MVAFSKIVSTLAAALPVALAATLPQAPAVTSITCGGQPYTYESLAGYGSLPGSSRDKLGDTLGGYGSAIFLEKKSWKRLNNGSYTGTLYGLPDRGWNTNGTVNYQNRIQKFKIVFTPKDSATVANPSGNNLFFELIDTILLTDPTGNPTTGLDSGFRGPYFVFPGFNTALPTTNYTGDGFGNSGPGGRRVTIDSEGLVQDAQGNFWVSDEYGPFVYKFNPQGRMTGVIRPPQAFIPFRNATASFSSNNPPIYAPNLKPTPGSPDYGRNNNQGLEGLTMSPDGKTLYLLLQSATIQDGASNSANRRNTRFLIYDITCDPPAFRSEYVVQLPIYNGNKVAAQSEVHYVSDTQFLVLARDSGNGASYTNTTSAYRQIDVFDISGATNIIGPKYNAINASIATRAGGVLDPAITPAQYCPFLDFNINSQLNRFGARNGGAQGPGLLNEKWEGIALGAVDGKNAKDGEYYLFTLSDNDFITQNGYINGGRTQYKDASGFDLDNQALVFKVKLPTTGKL